VKYTDVGFLDERLLLEENLGVLRRPDNPFTDDVQTNQKTECGGYPHPYYTRFNSLRQSQPEFGNSRLNADGTIDPAEQDRFGVE
jgi:hypothetical protein